MTQPNKATPSWCSTVVEQANRIGVLFEESPSLKPYLEASIARAYGDARREAVAETELPRNTFPSEPTSGILATLGATLNDEDVQL